MHTNQIHINGGLTSYNLTYLTTTKSTDERIFRNRTYLVLDTNT